ncbi:hypothetical protein PAU_01341 [Photorhabdus asymbiotica]|uniref:Uncharacterized protein n=1 Tax=Photorhabdus asymbiotica subsp. asymbiotica (strain ATCC 43949 / 3105-77) TaxID=553480 RepID=C7BRN2_PHOAA|nr:hypothetical protein PAU_01341 [Photorhabdus asymbiotica]
MAKLSFIRRCGRGISGINEDDIHCTFWRNALRKKIHIFI